jgi:DNA ligase-associated metallophosphoesterase
MNPLAADAPLQLLPEGAAFLTASSTLIVADLHLGKSATFRARGLPVPEGDTARDLARLCALAEKYRAAQLVIAGDFFHAAAGLTQEVEAALSEFLHAIGIPVTLVVGNHDLKLKQIPTPLHSVPALDLEENFRVIHDPADAGGEQLHLCGHWHPVVKIRDGKRSSLRFPCFLLRHNTLVLPAFGSFTGGAVLTPTADDRVFVALRETLVELPHALIS